MAQTLRICILKVILSAKYQLNSIDRATWNVCIQLKRSPLTVIVEHLGNYMSRLETWKLKIVFFFKYNQIYTIVVNNIKLLYS